MSVLECAHAGLVIGKHRLLSEISFGIERGEILGIAGRNGAGKSSLLRLASGEARCTEGAVMLHGRPLHAIAPRERARRLAILPQHSNLQFDYSVSELVSLGRIPHGDAQDSAVQEQVIALCDLEARAMQSYLTLSGGERQRAQLARVMAQLLPDAGNTDLGGQLLLLDEPTSAMDIPHQERFLALFRSLRDRGCAILLIMHDINLLSRCADRLLFLHRGRQTALGRSADLLTGEALSSLFEYPLRVSQAPDGAGVHITPRPSAHAD